MEENFHRRTFLNRISFGFASLLAAPFTGLAKNYKEAQSELKALANRNPILEVKAMGFQWETLDPFLFCVHHEDYFPKGNDQMGPATSLAGRSLGDDFIIKDGWRMYHGKKVPGFPGHPHRGFETVTVVRKGLVDHADSLGAAGRYGNGDVQWMTAGKGVQHSEMFPLLSKEKENPMELFQIWLNLPKRNKMVEPHFKMFWSETIPNYKVSDSQNKSTTVEVIAGKLGKYNSPSPPPNSWASDTKNEVAILNIKIEQGGSWTLPAASKGINRVLYFYQGDKILMAGTEIKKYHSIHVESDFDLQIINTGEEARILVLQGKPISEPVIQYGPFVMNTKEEINQAFEDYHKTAFGGWPWPRYDQVHDRNSGRFALHADGKKEIKP